MNAGHWIFLGLLVGNWLGVLIAIAKIGDGGSRGEWTPAYAIASLLMAAIYSFAVWEVMP